MAIAIAKIPKQEGVVATLRSKVPDLLRHKGWDRIQFQGHCRLKGLSFDTANRVYDGSTDLRTSTLAALVEVFEVPSIADLIDVKPETNEQ